MEIADYIIADDRALVELVLQGDNIAFEYLFERYKEAIHRLFIQRTNNPLDADDLSCIRVCSGCPSNGCRGDRKSVV